MKTFTGPFNLAVESGARATTYSGHAGFNAEAAIVALLRSGREVTVEEAAAETGCTDWTARRALKALAARDVVEMQHAMRPRWNRYRLKRSAGRG